MPWCLSCCYPLIAWLWWLGAAGVGRPCVSGVPWDCNNWRATSWQATAPRTLHRTDSGLKHIPSLSGKEAYLPGCFGLGAGIRFDTHLEATKALLGSSGCGMPFLHSASLQHTNVSKKGAGTLDWNPNSWVYCPGDISRSHDSGSHRIVHICIL